MIQELGRIEDLPADYRAAPFNLNVRAHNGIAVFAFQITAAQLTNAHQFIAVLKLKDLIASEHGNRCAGGTKGEEECSHAEAIRPNALPAPVER